MFRFSVDKMQAHVIDHTAGAEMDQADSSLHHLQGYIYYAKYYGGGGAGVKIKSFTCTCKGKYKIG